MDSNRQGRCSSNKNKLLKIWEIKFKRKKRGISHGKQKWKWK